MGVSLEFANNLWVMADKLRGNIQTGDYKDVALGLIFLKYISDSFEEKFNEIVEKGAVHKMVCLNGINSFIQNTCFGRKKDGSSTSNDGNVSGSCTWYSSRNYG